MATPRKSKKKVHAPKKKLVVEVPKGPSPWYVKWPVFFWRTIWFIPLILSVLVTCAITLITFGPKTAGVTWHALTR